MGSNLAASGEDDYLSTSRSERNFRQPREPQAVSSLPNEESSLPPVQGRRFVVQRHRASRLHYDFRLEMGGVLASWAVPKGPSMDSKVRRLAIHVEDHPLDYFDFEGVIPDGNYGSGDVTVWDWGTWAPGEGEHPERAIKAGELHVDLYGVKLTGRFMLLRTDRPTARQEQWLLFRRRDEFSVEGWDAESYPLSVKSGRTNDELRSMPELKQP
jgi:bifunctional non-homologous end joining protein LigD